MHARIGKLLKGVVGGLRIIDDTRNDDRGCTIFQQVDLIGQGLARGLDFI